MDECEREGINVKKINPVIDMKKQRKNQLIMKTPKIDNESDGEYREDLEIAWNAGHFEALSPNPITFDNWMDGFDEDIEPPTNQVMRKVICICGSTSFAELHAIKRWEFEKEGHICLMINYLPKWYVEQEFGKGVKDHLADKLGEEFRIKMDELHFRKIDMSDEIFVINYAGYIGESTRNEIEYAEKQGKPIHYLEQKYIS